MNSLWKWYAAISLILTLLFIPVPARASEIYHIQFDFIQQPGEIWTTDEINTAYWETVRAANYIGGIEIEPPGVIGVNRYEWENLADTQQVIYHLPRGEMTIYVFKDDAHKVFLNGWCYIGNSAVMRYSPSISGTAYHELRHLIYLLPPEPGYD